MGFGETGVRIAVRHRRPSWLPLIMVAFATLWLAGCAAQTKKQATAPNGSAVPGYDGRYGYGPATPGSRRDFAMNVGDKVYFDTDSAELTLEAQDILRAQAVWLNRYPQYAITIEGHADERGTREYNLALGARRAIAVKRFLIAQGVNPARMRTISYGKERPVALCDDITCWAKNRRAITLLHRPSS